MNRLFPRLAAFGWLFVWIGTSALGQSAGSLDATFSLYKVAGRRVLAVAAQPDGKTIIGGTFSQIDGVARATLARVNSDGSLDAGFVPPAIQSYDTLTDNVITKTNPTFAPAVFAIALQADGKVLVGGSFYFISGKPGFGGLVRLNADGSLDSGFGNVRFNGTVMSILPLSDGTILVGGDYNSVGTRQRNALVRLNADGSIDNDFDAGKIAGTFPSNVSTVATSAYPAVAALAATPSGGVYIGGIFTSVDGKSRRAIALLHHDGSVDNSFVPDSSFNQPPANGSSGQSLGQVLALALQMDGKVVAGGSFFDPNTQTQVNSITRFNTDGSLDAAFNPGGAGTYAVDQFGDLIDPTVRSITLQSDGRILIGGGFREYNNVTANALARLNTDGTLDTSFNDGNGPDDAVIAIAPAADGQLLAGGLFYSVDGVRRPAVARFNLQAGTPPGVTVTIAATTRRANAAIGKDGVFTFTRTGGNLLAALQIAYTIGGTAVPGVDYQPLTEIRPDTLIHQVVIHSGSTSATVPIVPIADPTAAATETVTLSVSATAGFTVQGTGSATVKIVNPD